jgi:hypothetical protein
MRRAAERTIWRYADGVAIRCFRNEIDGDVARRPRSVFNHDRLPNPRGQLFREQPCKHIWRGTRWKSDYQTHRLERP